MTLIKKLQQPILNGIITGALLASATLFWIESSTSALLPLMATTWWLVIFGSSLVGAYHLSIKKFTALTNIGLQTIQAFCAGLIYFAFHAAFYTEQNISATVKKSTVLQAGTSLQSEFLFQNELMMPIVFVLILLTSGLLYSILSKPSAR